MSKAERRKRAKHRAKERANAAQAQLGAVVAEAAPSPAVDVEGGRVEETSPVELTATVTVEDTSRYGVRPPAQIDVKVPAVCASTEDYITEPLPAAPAPRREPARQAAALIDSPVVQRELERQVVEDELDELDGEDEDEDDDLEGGEDDDEDDDEDDADDAIVEFVVECLESQRGGRAPLTWREAIPFLGIAEVDDPRLALLCSLLAHDDRPVSVTDVLTVLGGLELGELVEEAREILAEGGEQELDPEDRRAVQASAAALKTQARRELGGSRREQPRKASQLGRNRALEISGRTIAPQNATRPR